MMVLFASSFFPALLNLDMTEFIPDPKPPPRPIIITYMGDTRPIAVSASALSPETQKLSTIIFKYIINVDAIFGIKNLLIVF